MDDFNNKLENENQTAESKAAETQTPAAEPQAQQNDSPAQPQQTETQSSGRTLPKRVRMRLKARLDKRRARLSDLISAKKNDNEQSNTEENDNEKK